MDTFAAGLPGESALMEAYAQLPIDMREPIRELIEKSATAARQRYWAWIEERDKR